MANIFNLKVEEDELPFCYSLTGYGSFSRRSKLNCEIRNSIFNCSNLISGVGDDIFCLCTFHCSCIIILNYKTNRQWECVWRQQERHCDILQFMPYLNFSQSQFEPQNSWRRWDAFKGIFRCSGSECINSSRISQGGPHTACPLSERFRTRSKGLYLEKIMSQSLSLIYDSNVLCFVK